MMVTWDDYMAVSDATEKFVACRRERRSAFEQQRETLRRIVEATSPKVAVCLGAGVLNDIPYAELIRSGATVHLVDWLAGAVETGVSLSIISFDSDQPQCIYCDPDRLRPEAFCSNYKQPGGSNVAVCGRFVLCPGDPPTCEAFATGEFPKIHREDVTGGYASRFGRAVTDELRTVRNWAEAFSKATRLARRLDKVHDRLPIDDDSADLVTSSMVISQFAHEPYEFFSRRTAEQIGPPRADKEQQLLPAMEKLRSTLFVGQVRQHCQEIDRMLSPDGVCYLSFEMFHAVPSSETWFLVEGVAKVLEVLDESFLFCCDLIPESQSIQRFQVGQSPSMVFSLALRSRRKAGQ